MTDTTLIDDRAEALILAMVAQGIFIIEGDGKVWRVAEQQRDGTLKYCVRRRAEFKSTNGYRRIRVSVNGIRIRVSAHRVVFRYFHGDIPPGHVVDHRNRDRTDNHPDNLEAVTVGENNRRGRWASHREK